MRDDAVLPHDLRHRNVGQRLQPLVERCEVGFDGDTQQLSKFGMTK